MSKVYVTQMTHYNLSPAMEFGELVVLMKSPWDRSYAPQQILGELRQKLVNFSDDDYLLLVGDPVAMAIAVNVAAEMNNGWVRVLKWCKERLSYYVITLNLYDMNPTT